LWKERCHVAVNMLSEHFKLVNNACQDLPVLFEQTSSTLQHQNEPNVLSVLRSFNFLRFLLGGFSVMEERNCTLSLSFIQTVKK